MSDQPITTDGIAEDADAATKEQPALLPAWIDEIYERLEELSSAHQRLAEFTHRSTGACKFCQKTFRHAESITEQVQRLSIQMDRASAWQHNVEIRVGELADNQRIIMRQLEAQGAMLKGLIAAIQPGFDPS